MIQWIQDRIRRGRCPSGWGARRHARWCASPGALLLVWLVCSVLMLGPALPAAAAPGAENQQSAL